MKKLEETIEQIEQLLSKLFSYRLFWILSIIVVVIILFLVCYFWVFAPDFLNLTEGQQQARELHSGLIRNRAWILWMLASFTGLTIGLWLTNRGRKTQEKQWQTQEQQWKTQEKQWETQEKQWEIDRKSHIQERLEKATSMLINEAMPMRITACRLLMNLAIEDPSMKAQCVHLLFSFINNPYLKPDEQDNNFNNLFPKNKILRADIQEAIKSFSAIYNHYKNAVIDNERVELPTYFWQNKCKDRISLIKADLCLLNLGGAYLWQANLQEANLDCTSLQGANLSHANLQKAILTSVNLQGANLNWANLQGADVSLTNLQGADLTLTNLQGADIQYAILKRADLSKANLRDVNFDDTNLQNANFIEADITGAKMNLVENLTKEQILSAQWGFDEEGRGPAPLLPEEFDDDPEVQEWRRRHHFDNRKKTS